MVQIKKYSSENAARTIAANRYRQGVKKRQNINLTIKYLLWQHT